MRAGLRVIVLRWVLRYRVDVMGGLTDCASLKGGDCAGSAATCVCPCGRYRGPSIGVVVAAFWHPGHDYSESLEFTVTRVPTENGSCYQSGHFNVPLSGTKDRYARPYRPQTKGKIELFHRALAIEWAWAQDYDSEQARAVAY